MGRTITTVRILLGVVFLISGLNWFIGFFPMLPNIWAPADLPVKHAVVAEMIRTGWMFQAAKIIELLVGLSLLANRAVPLMLVAALPVSFITFMLDALVLDDIWRWCLGTETTQELLAALADMVVGGLCVLLAHVWLMLCYFEYYRPMVVWKADLSKGTAGDAPSVTVKRFVPGQGRLRSLFVAMGWVALLLEIINLYVFMTMV